VIRSSVIVSDLTGFSRALYSNWLWHRPLQLLIDAGEGLPLALGSNVFSPSVVAITHGHSDHVLGLPGFAGARRFGKGAPDKPWSVIYPENSTGVTAIQTAIAELWRGVAFPITWIPARAGSTHPLSRHRSLQAFAVTHVPPLPAFGYRVLEMRQRLRPEHAHLPVAEIERQAREHGRAGLMESFQHVVFAHSGDAMPIDPELVRDADLLVHDATFLGAEERREPIHATSEEALQVARAAGVRVLVLNHLSIRYDRATAIPRLRKQVVASGFGGECWLLDEGQFVNLKL
jgi:ribonuclease Z